jgi:hypothetical protein
MADISYAILSHDAEGTRPGRARRSKRHVPLRHGESHFQGANQPSPRSATTRDLDEVKTQLAG